jgi:hypothetical protein
VDDSEFLGAMKFTRMPILTSPSSSLPCRFLFSRSSVTTGCRDVGTVACNRSATDRENCATGGYNSVQILVERSDFAVAPCSEKQVPKVLRTQHPLQFPECKEGNESAKYDQAAADKVIEAYLARSTGHTVSMEK